MWIIPKNYELYPSAQDMVASREELKGLGKSLEHSLTLKSKVSPLATWSRRWKTAPWFRHLCGRILKRCHWSRFEDALTLSLAGIPANLFQMLDAEEVRKTQGTSGHTYVASSMGSCQKCVSSRTSKDTSHSDCDKCLQTWKQEVIQRRGVYSARAKLAHRTKGKGCLSWLTPTTQDSNKATKKMREGHQNNLTAVVFNWPTPDCSDRRSDKSKQQGLSNAVRAWPTPAARDYKGAVSVDRTHEKLKQGERPHMGTLDAFTAYHESYGLPDQAKINIKKRPHGQLNPDWVEQLMGLPIGWTDFAFSVTE